MLMPASKTTETKVYKADLELQDIDIILYCFDDSLCQNNTFSDMGTLTHSSKWTVVMSMKM
jgi:hypothetical protein